MKSLSSNMSAILLFAVLLVLGSFVLSCSSGNSVTSGVDGDSEQSENDISQTACNFDVDCPEDMQCHGGFCVTLDSNPCADNGDCASDSDCGAAQYCNDFCKCLDMNNADGDKEDEIDFDDDGNLNCDDGSQINSEPSLDFGYAQFDTDVMRKLHITNLCDNSLTIENIQIISTSSEFSLLKPFAPVTITGMSETFELEVVYHPTDLDLDEGELAITSNDPAGIHRVKLITQYKGSPKIEASPNPLDFLSVEVGLQASSKTVIIKNIKNDESDNAILRINSIYLDSQSLSTFTIGNISLPLYIGKGRQVELAVDCHPSEIGDYSDKLVFESNDPLNSTYEVEILCKGIRPALDVQVLAAGNLLDFGVQNVNQPTSIDLVLTNVGGGNLTVEIPELSQDSSAAFTIDTSNFNSTPKNLGLGESILLPVTYLSDKTGADIGRIDIANTSYLGTFIVNLAGRAANSLIKANPNPLDFGQIRVGQPATLQMTLSNDGDVPVTLTEISLADTDFGLSFVDTDVLTDILLAPTDTHTLNITFDPTGRGVFNTMLHFTTDDAGAAEGDVPINAIGIAPVIEVSELDNPAFTGTLDFDEVRLNHIGERILIIENNGDATLQISAMEITENTDDDEFSFVDNGITQILAGNSTQVVFHYEPDTYPQQDSGLFLITSDDPTTEELAVPLKALATNQRLAIAPASPPFNNLHFGDSQTVNVQLTNSGTVGVLAIEAIEFLSGDEAFSFVTADLTEPYLLYPQDNFLSVELTFLPPDNGQTANEVFNGQLQITTNSYLSDTNLYDMSGIGEPCPDGCWDLDGDPSLCEYCDCQIDNGGVEICDDIDNDCNGITDDTENVTANCTPPQYSEAICEDGACDFVCDNDFHRCADACVFDWSIDHCGTDCDPCETPDNATSLCEDVSGFATCTFDCNDGYLWHDDECLLTGSVDCCGAGCVDCGANPANGSWACEDVSGMDECVLYCNPYFHACDGACVDNFAVATCGSNCDACTEPDGGGGNAICENGLTCSTDCNSGHYQDDTDCPLCDTATHCGLDCLNCGDGVTPPNGLWACDAGSCALDCTTGYHECNNSECLNNSDTASCGTNCEACAEPTTGGHAVCVAASICSTICDAGYYRDNTECLTCDVADHCGASCMDCGDDPANGAWDCESDTCILNCYTGYHACGSVCVDSNSVDHCGINCSACVEPDDNGHASCDGNDCSVDCDGGFYPVYGGAGVSCQSCNVAGHCGFACTDCGLLDNGYFDCLGGACEPSCNLGYHLCGGACVADDSTDHCGTNCTACTEPFTHGHAVCENGSGSYACDIACDSNYHLCDDECLFDDNVNHCGSYCGTCEAELGVIAHGAYLCPAGTCEIDCDDGYHFIGGECLPGNTPSCCGITCEQCAGGQNADPVCIETSPGVYGCDTECKDNYYDINGDGTDCEYYCEYQGADDVPDDAYIDRNCDGIDGLVSESIFVASAADGGHDSNAGTMDDPLGTINAAITAVMGSSVHKRVLVSAGTYDGTVTLANTVHVHGGYSKSNAWERGAGYTVTISVTTAEGGNNRQVGVYAHDITTATTFDKISISVDSNNALSGSNYGMHIKNAAALTLNAISIAIGSGGDGSNGDGGNNATYTGNGGGNGEDGCDDGHTWACEVGGYSCSEPTVGAAGQQLNCQYGTAPGNGGAGGRPGKDNDSGNTSGLQGDTAPGGGTGGAGGTCCSPPGEHGSNGGNGLPGNTGANGIGGSGFGSISADYYQASNGLNGTDGNGGKGGGGGGGGGGGESTTIDCESYGGAGGGGGSGGCGGQLALGGNGGGAVFGVFFVNTQPTINSIFVTAAIGGTGGAGGTGGSGKVGGSAGSGGPGEPSSVNDASGDGGNGGTGGAGGRGGHGGGGGGGPSYCFYTTNTGASPNLGANTCSGYDGGTGGTSAGTAGTSGNEAVKNW